MAIDCPPELRGLSAAEGFAAVTDWSKINASPSGDKLIWVSNWLGKTSSGLMVPTKRVPSFLRSIAAMKGCSL